jgi:hypothetical protein
MFWSGRSPGWGDTEMDDKGGGTGDWGTFWFVITNWRAPGGPEYSHEIEVGTHIVICGTGRNMKTDTGIGEGRVDTVDVEV